MASRHDHGFGKPFRLYSVQSEVVSHGLKQLLDMPFIASELSLHERPPIQLVGFLARDDNLKCERETEKNR